ncbi:CoA transferase [soil metagenome]
MSAAPQALAGVKVLDLTRVLAGPLCTMQLGDMGAEVIKVESTAGDDTRGWGPPFIEGESAYFLGVNRNKRSVVIDLADDAGQAQLRELIRWADVLVDNFKVGTFDRWGLTDAWFDAETPRLIRCSISGYGSSGPQSRLPGYDFILQAESGLMSICGEADGRPMKYGVAIVDITTGLLACNGILMALQARHLTGKGQKVETSLFESGLFMLANVASNHLATGKTPGRFENGHPNIVPYSTYPASDGILAIAVGNDAQYAKFAEVIGLGEPGRDERFRTNAGRVGHRAELDALIETAMQRETSAHWVSVLMALGIPVGRINSVDQALSSPQAVAREMVQSIPLASGATLRTLGFPIKYSNTPATVRLPPPHVGEHTDEVLAELGRVAS